MTLKKKGEHSYGDSQADIQAELRDYSKSVGYPSEHYADASCKCGSKVFKLSIDDTVGAGVRTCLKCAQDHPMGDSAEYLDEASLEECECPCGKGSFEVTVGVALYEGSQDVKWIYVGCRCTECGLTACYADWKNEFEDFRKLLAMI